MTNEEALEYIREHGITMKGYCINTEVVLKAIEALEKQIAKKPIKNKGFINKSWSEEATLCPNCKGYLCGLPNYCRDCGIKIDWSDYDG